MTHTGEDAANIGKTFNTGGQVYQFPKLPWFLEKRIKENVIGMSSNMN